MTHSHPGKPADPNLIPLLDLVLQLVMFFMVCANFVMEQVNESIKLPVALAAAPLGAKDEYVIFLNVDKNGHVLLSALDAVGGDAVLTNPKRVENYMRRRYDEDIRAAGGDRSKPPRSVVVLRADKEAAFVRRPGSDKPGVYEVMKACRAAGYEKIQLRAVAGDRR
jgi:biopolymer transport protein ExbD